MKTGCYLTVKGRKLGQQWVELGWGGCLSDVDVEVDVDEEEMLVPCQLLV